MAEESHQQRQRSANRARIVQATSELLSTRGYEDTTAGMIAKAAGISRAAFYLHFSSKAEATAELMCELEPILLKAYLELDRLEPDVSQVRAWIERQAEIWRADSGRFLAISQAMALEQLASDAWFDAMLRICDQMTRTITRLEVGVDGRYAILSFMFMVDRGFHFTLLRGQGEFFEPIAHTLAMQWAGGLTAGGSTGHGSIG